MNLTKRLLPVVLMMVVSVLVAGCCVEPEPVQPEPAIAPVPTPKPAPKPAPTPSPCGPVAVAEAKMTLPAGEASCGVVRIERSAPKQVTAGANFDYTLKLINLTKAKLSGVRFRERLVSNLDLVGTSPKSMLTGKVIEWNVGDLNANESKLFTVRGKAVKPGRVVGCASVVFDMPEVCLAIDAVQPSLKVVKAAPAQAILCDEIPYKITVSNNGTGPACNVIVSDTLPEGLMTLDGKKAVAYKVGNLLPGQSRDVSFKVKAQKKGKFTNVVTAAADGGPAAKSSPVTTTVVNPELKVTKTGPAVRYMGRPGTYEITVANVGDGEARNTVLRDTAPGTTTLISAEGAKVTGNTAMWSLGTIPAGEARKVAMTVRFNQVGAVRNVAEATAYCTKASGVAMTEIKGIAAILLECVDLSDPIEVGSTETYQITVTNQGSAVDTNIVVECTLPAEQQFVSAAAPVKEKVAGQKVTFAPLATLAPKAKAIYKVTVKCLKPGDVRFQVSLNSDQMNTPSGETESTRIYSGD